MRFATVSLLSTRVALVVAFALVLADVQLAHAQDRSPEELIEAGVTARRGGDDAAALVLFTQAWERSHTPRARAQMGLAEYSLGNLVDGEAHLFEALQATTDEWIVGRRAALEESLAGVRARLAQLDLQVDQPGAQVRINERDVGTLPLPRPLWLMPGTMTIAVSAPGFAPSTRSVTMTAGQFSRERFVLVPVASTSEPAPPPSPVITPDEPARSSSPLPLIGWITAGGGVVGVGLGIVFYAQRESAMAKYNDDARCLLGDATRGETCGPHLADAQSAETLEAVSFVLGGLLVAGGLALVLFGGGSSEEAPAPTSVSARCAPLLGSVLGAACEGRF